MSEPFLIIRPRRVRTRYGIEQREPLVHFIPRDADECPDDALARDCVPFDDVADSIAYDEWAHDWPHYM